MGKNLYSLILQDEVIFAVDKIAHRYGTSRSALINRILAEYCDVPTPEKMISNIFSEIERIFGGDSDIIPLRTAGQTNLSLKSCLNIRYRPTVRYDVYLQAEKNRVEGVLTVNYRTTSAELIERMLQFFRILSESERKYCKDPPEYRVEPGKFERSFRAELPEDSVDGIGDAISAYISSFDTMLKGYIEGIYDEKQVDSLCRRYRLSTVLPL